MHAPISIRCPYCSFFDVRGWKSASWAAPARSRVNPCAAQRHAGSAAAKTPTAALVCRFSREHHGARRSYQAADGKNGRMANPLWATGKPDPRATPLPGPEQAWQTAPAARAELHSPRSGGQLRSRFNGWPDNQPTRTRTAVPDDEAGASKPACFQPVHARGTPPVPPGLHRTAKLRPAQPDTVRHQPGTCPAHPPAAPPARAKQRRAAPPPVRAR